MKCEHFRQLIDDLVDGRLTASGEAELREHIVTCSDCSAEFTSATALITAITASFRESRPQVSLKQRILASIPKEIPRRTLGGFVRHHWLSHAAAAVAVAVVLFFVARRLAVVPEEAGVVICGNVELRSSADSEFRQVAVGQKVFRGDTVRTVGNVSSELMVVPGVRIILDAGAEIVVAPDTVPQRSVSLRTGQLFAEVGKAPTPFQVFTPLGTVTTLGTKFCVSLDKADGEDVELVITIEEGAVQVDRAGQREIIRAGFCWQLQGQRVRCRQEAHVCHARLQWVEHHRERCKLDQSGSCGDEGRCGHKHQEDYREQQSSGQ